MCGLGCIAMDSPGLLASPIAQKPNSAPNSSTTTVPMPTLRIVRALRLRAASARAAAWRSILALRFASSRARAAAIASVSRLVSGGVVTAFWPFFGGAGFFVWDFDWVLLLIVCCLLLYVLGVAASPGQGI